MWLEYGYIKKHDIEQIVSKQDAQSGNKYSTYLHLGSNVWFKEFANGGHGDRDKKTPHRPISVTGGDYDKYFHIPP